MMPRSTFHYDFIDWRQPLAFGSYLSEKRHRMLLLHGFLRESSIHSLLLVSILRVLAERKPHFLRSCIGVNTTFEYYLFISSQTPFVKFNLQQKWLQRTRFIFSKSLSWPPTHFLQQVHTHATRNRCCANQLILDNRTEQSAKRRNNSHNLIVNLRKTLFLSLSKLNND